MYLKKILTAILFSFYVLSAAPALLPHLALSADDDETTAEADSDGDFAESTAEFEALFSVTGNDIISYAKKYLGRPYSRGAAGPRAFDCSGFTSFVFKGNNISLGRSSRDQFQQGVHIDRKDLRKGDLVFFSSPGSGRSVGHVGIVTDADGNGNFSFIHAARGGIKIDNYAHEKYYRGRYLGARRILDY